MFTCLPGQRSQYRRLATGWTVRDRISVGLRYSAPAQTDTAAHSVVGTESLSWYKAARAWHWPPTPI